MEEKTSGLTTESTQSSAAQESVPATKNAVPVKAETEHRQAYGTAKTENLRDSGLWRVLLPTVVVIFCAVLFIIPLGILIPLLVNSVRATRSSAEGQLIWLWIVMIVIELGAAFIIARGILRIFLTQAGNYQE